MGSRLSLSYDTEGDILYLEAVPPYAAQFSDEIADGVVARMNPDTGEVECLEILSFRHRFKNLGDVFELPLAAHLRLLPA